MAGWFQDLRHALRNLASRPGFALAAMLTLALGLGANVAIFSVFDAVVLRPLPYHEPDRLMALWESNPAQGLAREQISPVNFVDYRALDRVFADAAAWWRPEINLVDDAGEPVRATAVETSRNLFELLGVAPALGAGFTRQDGAIHGSEREVVLGHGLWSRRYGADAALIGRTIRLNDVPYTVVGVMPPGFEFPGHTEIWQGLTWNLANHSRFAHFMEGVARLEPGVEPEQAAAELLALSRRLAAEHADSNTDWMANAGSLHREIAGELRPRLLLMLVAVGLLLLLACANVANLLLARASTRDREVALRSALGASKGRLLRLFFAESLLLAAGGAVMGLVLARLGIGALAAATPIDIPRLGEVAIDARALVVCLGATLLTAFLFGLAPALQLSSPALQQGLKEAGRGASAGRGRRMVRSGLVVVEVAVAVVLLVGAGLLSRSFLALLKEEPGFSAASVLTANIQLPGTSYGDWNKVAQFTDEVVAGLAARPGVRAAAAASYLPLEQAWRFEYSLPGEPAPEGGALPWAQLVTVSDGYFDTLGIPLLAGRGFTRLDTKDSPPVMVINETLARRAWPNQNPIGKRLSSTARGIGPLGRRLVASGEYEIVGVVGDVKNTSLGAAPEPATYVVARQFPYRTLHLIVRGDGGAPALAGALRAQMRQLDAGLALSPPRTGEQILGEATAVSRFSFVLLGAFAALALLLAAVGIYGVLSYIVAQRRGEIGVRLALGASPSRVRSEVVREGLVLGGLGALAGGVGAVLLARFMASLLFGVRPTDPTTLAGVGALVLAVVVAACYLPARRASAVDPLEALRAE